MQEVLLSISPTNCALGLGRHRPKTVEPPSLDTQMTGPAIEVIGAIGRTYPRRSIRVQSSSRTIYVCLFATLFLLLSGSAPRLQAQGASATVQGSVADDSHAAIQGATVTLQRTETGVKTSTITNAAGLFVLPPVPPGHYQIFISAAGYELWTESAIDVEIGQVKQINAVLKIGSVSQSVVVTGTAPEINTETADRGTVAESTLVANIPLDVRNPFQLTEFTPGVNQSSALTAGTNSSTQSTTNTFYINGNKGNESDILIDGATDTVNYDLHAAGDIPGLDAVREFKIYTDAYSPEFGHTAGGIASYSIKSGTNAIHGGAWEYFRNQSMDARIYGATSQPQFGRNQFGAQVGGPVVLPHIYHGRDRTFFFISYEELRDSEPNQSGAGTTTTVPTARERTGDFSQTFNTNGTLDTVYDPSTTVAVPVGGAYPCPDGKMYPLNSSGMTTPATQAGYYRCPAFYNGAYNVLNPAVLNPIAQALLSIYPLPNQAGVGGSDENNYFSAAADQHHGYSTDIRIDHKFNNKHSIFGHYDDYETYIVYGPVFGQPSLTNNDSNDHIPGKNIMVDHTWILTPSLIFDHHLSWAHMGSLRTSESPLGTSKFDIPASVTPGATSTFTPEVVGVTNQLGSIGNLEPLEQNPNSVYQYSASLSWLKGIHTFKFGVDLRRYQDQLWDPQLLTVNTSNSFTGGSYANSVTKGTGNAIAELLLGQATITSGYIPKVNFRHQYYAVYAEDSMKVTHKLTLTYGLRYSIEGSDVANGNELTYVDTKDPSAIASQIPSNPYVSGTNLVGGVGVVGLNGTSRGLQIPGKLHFEPRLGAAYALDDKTVIHAGAGIFYHATANWQGFPAAYGYTRTSTSIDAQSNGYQPLLNLSNPFPSGLPTPYGNNPSPLSGNNTGSGPLSIELGQSIDGDLRHQDDAYQESWSLDVQRVLPAHFVVTAAYAGNVGVHLQGAIEYNQLTDAQLATGSALTTAVSNPFYNIITDSSSVLSKPTVEAGLLERPYPQFENFIGLNVGWGHANYQAAQLTVEHRMSQGLSTLIAYTYSKNIDDIGENGYAASIQDNGCLPCERSVADLDETNVFRVSTVYELPFGPGKPLVNHGFLSHIIGGWETGGTYQYNTGQPLQLTSPNQLTSTLYTGGTTPTPYTGNPSAANIRPTLVPGESITKKATNPVTGKLSSFNPAAFVETGEFSFGNTPRYLSNVRMPAYWDLDALLSKTTRIKEGMTATFRIEALNAFNHPVFGSPDIGVTDTNFGYNTDTQANSPRYVQISGRFAF